MRECTCSKCGRKFQENDSNPAVHYSTPSTVCTRCELLERLKPGDWYYDYNGNYVQKT
jgi:hypothetical protein